MFSKQIKGMSSLQETAQELLDAFPRERIFALYGAMGAGKTTFIKAICRALGSKDNITSPSFALINEYAAANGLLIYHFDFYRIKKIEEAYDLGYEDYIYSGNYCLIEWPEMIQDLLPQDIVHIKITETANGGRLFEAEKM